jgi:hypothetical protein
LSDNARLLKDETSSENFGQKFSSCSLIKLIAFFMALNKKDDFVFRPFLSFTRKLRPKVTRKIDSWYHLMNFHFRQKRFEQIFSLAFWTPYHRKKIIIYQELRKRIFDFKVF